MKWISWKYAQNIVEANAAEGTAPGLTTEDFNRISETQENKNWYVTIKQDNTETKIVAKKPEGVNCYFLNDEGLCEIYSNRPLDCKLFPLFFKIKKETEQTYNLRWLIWYCPLTDAKSTDLLKKEAKVKIENILSDILDQLFEYQEVMYASKGYKKKHFLCEELLKSIRSEEN